MGIWSIHLLQITKMKDRLAELKTDSDDDVEDDQDQVAAQQNDKKESKKRKSRKESHKESHISEEEKRANQLKEFFVEVNEVKASNKKIEEKVQELKAAH